MGNLNAPFYYDEINADVSSIEPNTAHIVNSASFQFFRRHFLKRAIAQLKFNIPKTWSRSFFQYTLFCDGYIAIFDANKKDDNLGVIPLNCTLTGNSTPLQQELNIWYEPAAVVISNPALKESYTLEIGKECALLKLQPDYSSILDVVDFFAAKMALLSQGIDMNIENTKLAYLFVTASKTAAESLKKLYDEIMSGNPAAVVDKDVFDELQGNSKIELFNNNISSNYITGDMLVDADTIENMFDSYIGVPNANTQKKERLISDEVNANNVETSCLIDLIMESLQDGIDKANELFNLDLSVERRYKPAEQEQKIESDSNNNRPL